MTNPNKIIQVLNKQVANWTVMYTKLHYFHWNIKGPHFFVLHEKFEEYYNEAANYVDNLAERVLTLGSKPIGTLKDCLNLSSIKEVDQELNEKQMIEILINDFKTIIAESKSGFQEAEEVGDHATADMLLSIQQNIEKHHWMLSSFLEE